MKGYNQKGLKHKNKDQGYHIAVVNLSVFELGQALTNPN